MIGTLIWAEFIHLYHAGARWITGGLVILGAGVWLLPGKPVGPFAANALLTPKGFTALAPMAYADVLEIGLPWAVATLVLLLQTDLRDASRSLTATWSVKTSVWAVSRVVAALLWGVGWLVAGAGIPALFGQPVSFVRTLIVVFPVIVVLAGVTFAASESFLDAWPGVLAFALMSLLGLGIPGLPFAQADRRNLEVFDGRNHLMSPGLIHNLDWLTTFGAAAFVVGWVAWDQHRKRGAYQS